MEHLYLGINECTRALERRPRFINPKPGDLQEMIVIKSLVNQCGQRRIVEVEPPGSVIVLSRRYDTLAFRMPRPCKVNILLFELRRQLCATGEGVPDCRGRDPKKPSGESG